MTSLKNDIKVVKDNQRRKGPPGKIKLAKALRVLLEEKDFNSITTAEIASTAGTNEALIYRYFGDKRGLLHRLRRKWSTSRRAAETINPEHIEILSIE